jgi:predicted outer membrane repeat protein
MKKFILIPVCLLVLSFTSTSWAKVIYISLNGSDANSGDSWAEAFLTIQHAVDESATDDEIWIEQGTYSLSNEILISGKDGLAIYGGFDGIETERSQRDWLANETIIDGQEMVRCLYIDGSITIDGLSINNGYTDLGGSGIYADMADLTIQNCKFIENSAGSGGAIYLNWTSGKIEDCTFIENTADEGGAIFGHESGLIIIEDCLFWGNHASIGGAIHGDEMSGPIKNCQFINNSALERGGAIYDVIEYRTIINCIFSGNNASEGGAISACCLAAHIIINCTFSQNRAINGGGALPFDLWGGGQITLTNSILWNNHSDLGPEYNEMYFSTSPEITYCNIEGYTGGGEGNINVDPLFVDPGNYDFHLMANSPCIDAGTSIDAPDDDFDGYLRPQGSGYDIGAYENVFIKDGGGGGGGGGT